MFNLWYYPPVEVTPNLFWALFIFWGFFGVIVREVFFYLDKFFKSNWIKVMLTAFILMILIEGINIFTRSWIYIPVNYLILYIGWVILVLTFHVVPEKFNFFR